MDALLIPVFVLAAITVPVLLIALLLYAVPVRAAVTVLLKGERQEQAVLISWGIFGIRTSHTGAGMLIEALLAGRAVLSHAGSAEQDRAAKTEPGPAGDAVPAGERIRGEPVTPSTTQPAGTAPECQPPPGPRPSAAPAPGSPDTSPLPGAPEGDRPSAGMPETSAEASPLPDVGELVHIFQKMIGPVGSFGSAFWQQSRFVSAEGTVTLGLGDPVLTGEVCGMYWASRFALIAARINVDLVPVFDREVLELDVTVRMKVKHPLLVLLAGLRLGLDPATREAAGFAMRQSRGAVPA